MRRLLLAGLLVLTACAPPAPALPPRPTLAVIVVVDGLAWHRVEAWRSSLDSGLERLLDEGRLFTQCRYPHYPTETGPGHASIATGVPPAEHGIVSNDWYEVGPDGALRSRYCLDPAPGSGETAPGPWSLAVPTLGDRLREGGRSRVVSLAGKDRAAVLLAGRSRGDAVYWYDEATGRFVTAPYYSPPPEIAAKVRTFDDERMGERLAATYGTVWEPLAPPAVAPTVPPAADLGAGQDPFFGIGFPHDLTTAEKGYFRGFSRGPGLDASVADLAIALLDDDDLALGRRDAPDLLALSFSALDRAEHHYGPESEEAFDLLRRLDRDLGRILDVLERKVGRDRIVLALSTDHGFSPLPETLRREDPASPAGRFDVDAGLVSVNAALERATCLPPGAKPVFAFDGYGLWYDRPRLPMRSIGGEGCPPPGAKVGSGALDAALPRAAAALEPFVRTIRPASPDDPSRFPGRSPDALVFLRDGVSPDWYHGGGSTHGTEHEYDVHVPLVFWGAGFETGEDATETTPYALAGTLRKALLLP